MIRSITLIVIVFLSVFGDSAAAGGWGPWSTSPAAPAMLTAADRESAPLSQEPVVHSVAATPFVWLLRIYQDHITHVDGDRCPMYPTCSRYSVLAIRRHGPVVGIIMTTDRLLHEGDEMRSAPLVRIGNRYRYSDPLDNNDFWWYRK